MDDSPLRIAIGKYNRQVDEMNAAEKARQAIIEEMKRIVCRELNAVDPSQIEAIETAIDEATKEVATLHLGTFIAYLARSVYMSK